MNLKLLLIPVYAIACSLASAQAKRPNIILIMADDVGWEAFGSYGSEDYSTPNLDRMAAQGIRFEHAYSTPLCTTSRVMIMTGQYNFRNYTNFGYLNPADRTFGNLMRDAGYKTAIAGKWQLNGLYDNLPRSTDSTRANDAGFDEYCLWQYNRKGGGKHDDRYWWPNLMKNGELLTSDMNAGKYAPDMITEFLIDFMERNEDEPFFIYYPMILVHSDFLPTPDMIDGVPKEIPSRNRKDRGELKDNFSGMMKYMDKIVGQLVAKTEELGIAEDTIFLFTADNGTHTTIRSRWNGQELNGGKGRMDDMGTHVPLIAYQKGKIQPAVIDDLVDFTDFYPTLADAAGIKFTESDPTDGRSFYPQLRGQTGNPRDWIICHYQPHWRSSNTGQFVRTAKYKLYRDGRFHEPAVDLKEQNDLSKGNLTDEQSSVRDKLQAIIDKLPAVPACTKGGDKKAGKNKKGPTAPKHSPDTPLTQPNWPNPNTF